MIKEKCGKPPLDLRSLGRILHVALPRHPVISSQTRGEPLVLPRGLPWLPWPPPSHRVLLPPGWSLGPRGVVNLLTSASLPLALGRFYDACLQSQRNGEVSSTCPAVEEEAHQPRRGKNVCEGLGAPAPRRSSGNFTSPCCRQAQPWAAAAHAPGISELIFRFYVSHVLPESAFFTNKA